MTRLSGRVRAGAVAALLAVAVPLGLVSGPAMAAPGDLDPSFSDDGMVIGGSNNGWMFEEPDFWTSPFSPTERSWCRATGDCSATTPMARTIALSLTSTTLRPSRPSRSRLTASSSPPGTPITRTSTRRRTFSSSAIGPMEPRIPHSQGTARRRPTSRRGRIRPRHSRSSPMARSLRPGTRWGSTPTTSPPRISPSPATTPTARSIQGSPARDADDELRR